MKKYIGGFFELEEDLHLSDPYHSNAIFLSSGRACLHLILKETKPTKVYVPFFTCDALLEPIVLSRIAYEFYSLTEALELVNLPVLGESELIIYINYFGLKTEAVEKYSKLYKEKLVVDNTQAFFRKEEGKSYSFNSARKSFGVPDGAYLYTPLSMKAPIDRNEGISTTHLRDRSEGRQQKSFSGFQAYENTISSEIRLGSFYSENILRSIKYNNVINKRRQNFQLFHQTLKDINAYQFDHGIIDNTFVPFSYPFLLPTNIDFKLFYNENIFLPIYWNDVIIRKTDKYTNEKFMSSRLAHFPIDHRYGKEEISFMINKLSEIIF